jgi:hypothetical protein
MMQPSIAQHQLHWPHTRTRSNQAALRTPTTPSTRSACLPAAYLPAIHDGDAHACNAQEGALTLVYGAPEAISRAMIG